jgi:hypothetical protein
MTKGRRLKRASEARWRRQHRNLKALNEALARWTPDRTQRWTLHEWYSRKTW